MGMAENRKQAKIFETRYFAFIIAACIIFITFFAEFATRIPDWL
jgi:hypothetical protein